MSPSGSRQDASLVLPFLVALLLAAAGHSTSAAVAAALGLGLVGLRIVLGRRLHGIIRSVGRRVEHALTAAAVAVMWVAVVPVAWASRPVRHRPTSAGWAEAAPATAVRRGFAGGSTRSRGTRPSAARVVGLVVLILAADVAVGSAWQKVTRSEAAGAKLGRVAGVDLEETSYDPRADGVALRDQPWADAYLRELQSLPGAYWPYTLTKPGDHDGRFITIDGWTRSSYQSSGPDRGPTLALFGGSAMFGEGQRDEHTIASELARLAEAEGLALHVVNYGQRAWTSWQEALLFEDVTATTDPPDLALFYDGANDVTTQLQSVTAGHPTHYDVEAVRARLESTPPVASEVWDWYTSHSALLKVARRIRGQGRADRLAPPNPVTSDDPPGEIASRTLTVYERARELILDVGRRRDIEVDFFWQPLLEWRENPAYAATTRRLTPPTIDLSDALVDHPEVYLDSIHTNEEGARRVAVRMWETLEPQVRDLQPGG